MSQPTDEQWLTKELIRLTNSSVLRREVEVQRSRQAILSGLQARGWKSPEEVKRERKKGVRDGYSYALTDIDLATSYEDAWKRVSASHKKAVEACGD